MYVSVRKVTVKDLTFRKFLCNRRVAIKRLQRIFIVVKVSILMKMSTVPFFFLKFVKVFYILIFWKKKKMYLAARCT